MMSHTVKGTKTKKRQ